MKELIRSILRETYLIEMKASFTQDEMKDIALKYSNFKEFKNKEPKLFAAIRRKGKDFENELTSHMTKDHYHKWTDDELRDEALKYQTKSEFQKNSPNAEAAARSKGKDFLDSITSHMEVRKKSKWSDEELENEAKKYEFKIDFQKFSPKAYAVSQRRGRDFFDKITSHLKNKIIHWTDDMLKDEALKYSTKADFLKGSPKAYQSAMNRGEQFWSKVTSHMPNIHKSWTDETLRDEALKYKTPTEFYNSNPSAYKLSRDRGKEFFQSVTQHMTRLTNWTEENIKKEALKYDSKPKFRASNGSAYQAADRLGIMDEVTAHMIPTGSKFKRLIYAYEFPDKSVYVGLTYDLNKRDWSHMNRDSSAVYKYMVLTGLRPIKKTLTKFIDKEEAKKLEGVLEKQYRDKGWKILNRAKTGSLGGSTLLWTPEKIRQLFLQYNDLTKLYNEQASAIQAAKREGMDFYSDVTSHIPRKFTNWSDEMLRDEAQKYQTRQDFRDNNEKAYNAAKRRGDDFYNDITSHMKHQRVQWTNDLLHQEALKFNKLDNFAKQSASAYIVARRKGKEFFDFITSHMIKGRTEWTVEKVLDEMKKYKTMAEFKTKSPKAYQNLKYRKLYSVAKDYYNSL